MGKEKRDLTYIVAKKGVGRRVSRPAGVKGTFRVVDGRLKKDTRAAQRKEQRGRGKGARGHKGGRDHKGGRGMKGGKGHANKKWWTPSDWLIDWAARVVYESIALYANLLVQSIIRPFVTNDMLFYLDFDLPDYKWGFEPFQQSDAVQTDVFQHCYNAACFHV